MWLKKIRSCNTIPIQSTLAPNCIIFKILLLVYKADQVRAPSISRTYFFHIVHIIRASPFSCDHQMTLHFWIRLVLIRLHTEIGCRHLLLATSHSWTGYIASFQERTKDPSFWKVILAPLQSAFEHLWDGLSAFQYKWTIIIIIIIIIVMIKCVELFGWWLDATKHGTRNVTCHEEC